MTVEKQTLRVEKPHGNCRQCQCVSDVGKRWSIAGRLERNKSSIRQLANSEASIHERQSNLALLTAEMKKFRKLTTKAAGKLELAQSDVVLL